MTDVFHAAARWWRRRFPHFADGLAEINRSSPGTPAVAPVQHVSDLATGAELLCAWHALGDTMHLVADLKALSVALLALSDQIAAEDRDQGGDTAWGRDATTAAGYARAAREAAEHGGSGLDGTLEALSIGLAQLHRRLATRRRRSGRVPRR